MAQFGSRRTLGRHPDRGQLLGTSEQTSRFRKGRRSMSAAGGVSCVNYLYIYFSERLKNQASSQCRITTVETFNVLRLTILGRVRKHNSA